MGPFTSRLALLGLLSLPATAAGGELYSFVDADGVIHLTNAPTSSERWRKVTRASDVAGVYRVNVQGRSTSPGGAGNGSWSPRPSSEASYQEHIRQAAEKYRVPVALLRAVMAVESNYNARAVSEKGAVGLMQLMPGTAKDMYVYDVWDPAQNIDGGARYLRLLANQYGGDLMRTLAAYNAGPDAVRRSGGKIPDIPETREYVRKVLALYQDFKAGR
jgi:soluble lytic murein transglycosylase-like protein